MTSTNDVAPRPRRALPTSGLGLARFCTLLLTALGLTLGAAHVLELPPPAGWLRVRPRWEYGHVAAFAAWLAGYGTLLLSVLADRTPNAAQRGASMTHPLRHVMNRS